MRSPLSLNAPSSPVLTRSEGRGVAAAAAGEETGEDGGNKAGGAAVGRGGSAGAWVGGACVGLGSSDRAGPGSQAINHWTHTKALRITPRPRMARLAYRLSHSERSSSCCCVAPPCHENPVRDGPVGLQPRPFDRLRAG